MLSKASDPRAHFIKVVNSSSCTLEEQLGRSLQARLGFLAATILPTSMMYAKRWRNSLPWQLT